MKEDKPSLSLTPQEFELLETTNLVLA